MIVPYKNTTNQHMHAILCFQWHLCVSCFDRHHVICSVKNNIRFNNIAIAFVSIHFQLDDSDTQPHAHVCVQFLLLLFSALLLYFRLWKYKNRNNISVDIKLECLRIRRKQLRIKRKWIMKTIWHRSENVKSAISPKNHVKRTQKQEKIIFWMVKRVSYNKIEKIERRILVEY